MTTLNVFKIRTDKINHEGGFITPLEVYELTLDNKAYEIHVGCKGDFKWEHTTYIYTRNGVLLKPSSPTYKSIIHFFWIAEQGGMIEDKGAA